MSLMGTLICLFVRRPSRVPLEEALADPPPVGLEPDGRDMWPELVRLDREATERLLTIQRLRGEIEVQARRREPTK